MLRSNFTILISGFFELIFFFVQTNKATLTQTANYRFKLCKNLLVNSVRHDFGDFIDLFIEYSYSFNVVLEAWLCCPFFKRLKTLKHFVHYTCCRLDLHCLLELLELFSWPAWIRVRLFDWDCDLKRMDWKLWLPSDITTIPNTSHHTVIAVTISKGLISQIRPSLHVCTCLGICWTFRTRLWFFAFELFQELLNTHTVCVNILFLRIGKTVNMMSSSWCLDLNLSDIRFLLYFAHLNLNCQT